MKALTICQPYAHLIVRGEKRVENRRWQTDYRGPLVIHAAKSQDWLRDSPIQLFNAIDKTLVYGAVVGIARLVAVLDSDEIDRGDYDQQYPWLGEHPYTGGPWCWVLDRVKRIWPIPWNGAQRLWEFPDELLPRLPVKTKQGNG